MLTYFYYPFLEVGINSYLQYKHHSDKPWLFPFYPFNNYKCAIIYKHFKMHIGIEPLTSIDLIRNEIFNYIKKDFIFKNLFY